MDASRRYAYPARSQIWSISEAATLNNGFDLDTPSLPSKMLFAIVVVVGLWEVTSIPIHDLVCTVRIPTVHFGGNAKILE